VAVTTKKKNYDDMLNGRCNQGPFKDCCHVEPKAKHCYANLSGLNEEVIEDLNHTRSYRRLESHILGPLFFVYNRRRICMHSHYNFGSMPAGGIVNKVPLWLCPCSGFFWIEHRHSQPQFNEYVHFNSYI